MKLGRTEGGSCRIVLAAGILRADSAGARLARGWFSKFLPVLRGYMRQVGRHRKAPKWPLEGRKFGTAVNGTASRPATLRVEKRK